MPTEFGFEYKVMAKRRTEKAWEPWTGVWNYQKRMTLEKVAKFMRERWAMKYMPENYDRHLDYGIFRRMVFEKKGRIIREKWGLIKVLKWAI